MIGSRNSKPPCRKRARNRSAAVWPKWGAKGGVPPRQQKNIVKKMQNKTRAAQKSLPDSGGRKDLVDRLANQQQPLTTLVARATQISKDAKTAEPVLSRQL